MLKHILDMESYYEEHCKKCNKKRVDCICPQGFTTKAPIIPLHVGKNAD